MDTMKHQDKIGAAILGFYAAIKICEKEGYEWRDVADLVEPIAKKHQKEETNTNPTPSGP